MLEAERNRLAANGSVTLSIKVRPQAQRTQVTGRLDDGTIKIDLAAAAEDGKANNELIEFLAWEFDVPRSSVALVSGQTSRKKVVRVKGRTLG